jgi:hypothetical protein
MKVIDLLNKIANGEIDRNNKYHFSSYDYCTINEFFNRYILDEENLNSEILEFKEEKKIPEKLDEYADVSGDLACGWSFAEKKLKDKINEIIDYLKSKGD